MEKSLLITPFSLHIWTLILLSLRLVVGFLLLSGLNWTTASFWSFSVLLEQSYDLANRLPEKYGNPSHLAIVNIYTEKSVLILDNIQFNCSR